MFTPLCLFLKDAQNHVHVDLKRSSSNLKLGQCKFDLRSMSKMSKLMVLKGQRSIFYIVLTLDQKAITAIETNASYE